MIVKIEEKTENSAFLDYMLFQEKDEPERKNMKVINLKVSDKRRTDYTRDAGIEADDDEPTPDVADTDGGVEAPEEPITDDADYTVDTGDEGGEEDAPAEGEDGEAPDEPVTDDEDYTSGAEGEGEEAAPEDSADAGGEGDAPPAEGEDDPVEQMYKYNLYQKFRKVLSSVKDYISELDNVMSDDAMINNEYKELTSKLKTIIGLMEDYMIMKFSKVSFMQSMLFYQRVMTGIDIILQTLKKIRTKELKSKT